MAPPTRLRAMLRHQSPVTAPPAARASLPVSAAPQRDSAGKPAGLSAEQVQSYVNDGFVVVSGLIPEHILAAARDSIWEQMAAPPKPPCCQGLCMSMMAPDFQINKATQDLLSTAIALCSTFSTGSGTQMY